MPVRTSLLRSRTINETLSLKADAARKIGAKTAFLSHSHKDRDLALGLQQLLMECNWNLYIDWQDSTMPETPNRETAQKIKDKIEQASIFLYLSTVNSDASRWCPWEIGYADKAKTASRIFIIPTQDDNGMSHGNEYLQLYKRIDSPSTYSNTLSLYDVNSPFGTPLGLSTIPN